MNHSGVRQLLHSSAQDQSEEKKGRCVPDRADEIESDRADFDVLHGFIELCFDMFRLIWIFHDGSCLIWCKTCSSQCGLKASVQSQVHDACIEQPAACKHV